MCTALHGIPCPCPRLRRHQRRLQGLKPPTTPSVAPQDAGLTKSGGMAYLDLVQLARVGESSTKVARGLFWSCLWIPSNTGSLGALLHRRGRPWPPKCWAQPSSGSASRLLGPFVCVKAYLPQILLPQALPPANSSSEDSRASLLDFRKSLRASLSSALSSPHSA